MIVAYATMMPMNTSTAPCAAIQKSNGQGPSMNCRSRAKKQTTKLTSAQTASRPAFSASTRGSCFSCASGSPIRRSSHQRGMRRARDYLVRQCGSARQPLPGVDHAVRVQGDRRDAFIEQPLREIRVVAGPLAADAHVLAMLLARGDRAREHRLDGRIA